MKTERAFTVELGQSKGVFILSGGKQVFQYTPPATSTVVLEVKIIETTKEKS